MKKENKMQVSVTCLLLVIALFIIAMMAYYIYNMRDEKKIAEHETQNLNAKVNDLQTKIVDMETKERTANNTNPTDQKDNNNQLTTENTSVMSNTNIPMEDLFAIDYNEIQQGNNINFIKISEGNLYYLDKTKINKIDFISPCKDAYVKIADHVKRVKSLTLWSDTGIGYLVIKEDGTVQMIVIENNKVSLENYEELAGDKVDDILDFDGQTFTLKLLDGTTKKVNHFSGGA